MLLFLQIFFLLLSLSPPETSLIFMLYIEGVPQVSQALVIFLYFLFCFSHWISISSNLLIFSFCLLKSMVNFSLVKFSHQLLYFPMPEFLLGSFKK